MIQGLNLAVTIYTGLGWARIQPSFFRFGLIGFVSFAMGSSSSCVAVRPMASLRFAKGRIACRKRGETTAASPMSPAMTTTPATVTPTAMPTVASACATKTGPDAEGGSSKSAESSTVGSYSNDVEKFDISIPREKRANCCNPSGSLAIELRNRSCAGCVGSAT